METFETLDKHFDNLDLKSFESGGENYFTASEAHTDASGVLGKVCTIYRAIAPFLKTVANSWFIPEKWKKYIKTFVDLMDQLCPGN